MKASIKIFNNDLRVKLRLDGVCDESFIIDGFHFLPRKDEWIDVEDLIDEKNYSEPQISEIYRLCWSVKNVSWGKDENGFFAEIICGGE